MAAVSLEVRAAGGNATTIAGAIALIPAATNDDYTILDYRENGAQATNDSPWSVHTDSVTFGVAGSLEIAGAPSNEYNHFTGTGAFCAASKNGDAAFDIGNLDKVYIRDIGFKNNATVNSSRALDFQNSGVPSSERVVCERVTTTSSAASFARGFNNIRDNVQLSHCIADGFGSSRAFSGTGAVDCWLINCMSMNSLRGVDCSASNCRMRVINHVYWNCTNDENGTVHIDSTRNASSNGSPQGTSPYVPALTAADFVDSDNGDFHLAPAGGLAGQAGEDRSADGITQDYDRDTITSWRIGLDALAGNAAPVVDVNTGYHIYEGETRPIRAVNLSASDPDEDAFNYIFKGIFDNTDTLISTIVARNNTVTMSVDDTFTQANIDAALIDTRVLSATAGSYEFRFQVDDGTAQSPVTAFNITVRPDPYLVPDLTLLSFDGTSIKDDVADVDFPGNSPRGGQFAFSGGLFIAVLDMLLQLGGGHGDHSGFLFWMYDKVNHYWFNYHGHSPDVVENASPAAQTGNDQGYYDDTQGAGGTFVWPASRHTYNNDIFWYEDAGKLYIGSIRQASTYATSGTFNVIEIYNFTDKTWESTTANPTRAASPLPDNIYGGFGGTLRSDNSHWWGLLTGTVVYSYDYIADTWKTHSVTGMAKGGTANDRYTSRIIGGKIWSIGQGVFGYIDISAGHANNAALAFTDVTQSGDTSIFGTDAPLFHEMLDGDLLAWRGGSFYRITEAGNATALTLSGSSVAVPALGTNDMVYQRAFRVLESGKEIYCFHPGDRFAAGDNMHALIVGDDPNANVSGNVQVLDGASITNSGQKVALTDSSASGVATASIQGQKQGLGVSSAQSVSALTNQGQRVTSGSASSGSIALITNQGAKPASGAPSVAGIAELSSQGNKQSGSAQQIAAVATVINVGQVDQAGSGSVTTASISSIANAGLKAASGQSQAAALGSPQSTAQKQLNGQSNVVSIATASASGTPQQSGQGSSVSSGVAAISASGQKKTEFASTVTSIASITSAGQAEQQSTGDSNAESAAIIANSGFKQAVGSNLIQAYGTITNGAGLGGAKPMIKLEYSNPRPLIKYRRR